MGAIATIWIGAENEEEAIAAAVRVVRHKVPTPHSSPGDIVLNRKTANWKDYYWASKSPKGGVFVYQEPSLNHQELLFICLKGQLSLVRASSSRSV